ncbi:MAG: type IV secretory system conjugative DNA transfer family protein [Bdellovibrionales bacterium]
MRLLTNSGNRFGHNLPSVSVLARHALLLLGLVSIGCGSSFAATSQQGTVMGPPTSPGSTSHEYQPAYVTSPYNMAVATDEAPSPPPPSLSDLQGAEEQEDDAPKSETMGLQIRADALREAGLSLGARGGLAFRTFQIQRRLAEYDTSLSKAYDFSRLLIPASSGFLIEPPIVSEAQRAVLVKAGGQAAAVADRVYRINRVARIVTAARNWRLYLERDWGHVDPPPAILAPKSDEERAMWREYVKQGWEAGVKQAEEIFEADLDRMTNDYVGMVRYRELLSQGMISQPYALADDRGITGGGSEMRIGDRGVAITGQSQLIPRSSEWKPATRQ